MDSVPSASNRITRTRKQLKNRTEREDLYHDVPSALVKKIIIE